MGPHHVQGKHGERKLPICSKIGVEYFAIWQGKGTGYGPFGMVVSVVVVVRRKAGKELGKCQVSVRPMKGGRHFGTISAGDDDWYLHRLAAWCFANPRNVSWKVFNQAGSSPRTKKWQAGHLSLNECDCRVKNLLVMTRKQNLAMYKDVALAKWGGVFKG